jgi:hypothetical protein
MPKRPVLIELSQSPTPEEGIVFESAATPFRTAFSLEAADVPHLPGIDLDRSFPAVAIPPPVSPADTTESMRFSLESVEDDPSATVLVRGFMEEANVESVAAAPSKLPGVRAIYADPLIETCPITCINSPAVGDTARVASAVCVSKLRSAGMTGAGVLLAIVDTGINLPYLRSRGLNPNFNSSRSWVPVIPGQPPLVPGNLPVDHGTMCAFDALIAAPDSMLVDIAVLQSRRPGRTVMEGLLSDAVLAYSFLHQILTGPRRPGDFHSMVVSNSWGMFRRQWDFPVGHPGNYSDNPNHPFNRIVGRLAQAGADILFAAGNCGRECPDSRCGAEIDAGIYGANSHADVLSVAGVDLNKKRVGYSTRGPGHLTQQKPDVASFTHFKGSGVYPVDGGTSAATPVAAGVVAAVRSRFPVGPTSTPAMLRNAVTRLSEDKGTIGFDFEYGWGVISGCKLSQMTGFTTAPIAGPGIEGQPSETTKENEIMSDQQFMQALESFRESGADVTAAPVDICGTYKKVKPILQGILPFLKLIPNIGKPAAKAIEALMAALDAFCAAPAPPVFSVEGGDDASFNNALAAFAEPGGGSIAAAAAVDICGTYKKVKPILLGLLPFLALIPNIGKAVAAALKALMAALDAHCGA